MYVYNYVDKTITKDTNITNLNHHCNTRLISTRWKQQLEEMLGMNISCLALNNSTPTEEREKIR